MSKSIIERDELWEYDLAPPSEPEIIVNVTLYEKAQRIFNLACEWRIRRRKRGLAKKTSTTDVSRGGGLEHLRAIRAKK